MIRTQDKQEITEVIQFLFETNRNKIDRRIKPIHRVFFPAVCNLRSLVDMNQNQREALDKHSTELSEALAPVLYLFFDHLEERKVLNSQDRYLIHATTTENKLMLVNVLELMKTRHDGWKAIVSYLRELNYANLADELEISAGTLVYAKAESGTMSDTFHSTDPISWLSYGQAEMGAVESADIRKYADESGILCHDFFYLFTHIIQTS